MFETEAVFDGTVVIILIWFGLPLEFYAELILVTLFVVVSVKRCDYFCIVNQHGFGCISL